MKRLLGATIFAAAIVPAAHSQSITTLFASNNGGSNGGSVFFDVAVAGNALSITGFDVNTGVFVPFTMSVYTVAGTYVGNELNAGAWTLVATGSGTGMGEDNPSPVTLNAPFNLAANTTVGMALVMDASANHEYTNGDGSNQMYMNSDIMLTLGAATNSAFGPSVFTPRVWNGTVYYTPVPEPATIAALSLGLGALLLLRRRNK